MIRGISFKVSQDQDRILWEIFQGIDVSKYIWYNIQSQNEAWCRRDNEILDKTFLKKSRYRGQEFLERIREKHFIVFLKLEAFEEETADYEVHSYEEFKESACKILLLIYDCEFVEIYVKEKKLTEALYSNGEKWGFSDMEFISEETDQRIRMDVV